MAAAAATAQFRAEKRNNFDLLLAQQRVCVHIAVVGIDYTRRCTHEMAPLYPSQFHLGTGARDDELGPDRGKSLLELTSFSELLSTSVDDTEATTYERPGYITSESR